MNKFTKLTYDASQSFIERGEKGEAISMALRYLPRMKMWVFDVSYNGVQLLTNATLINGPNILRAFRNNIPFGILCTSTDGLDAAYLDDFINQRVNIFLLTSDEVALVESEFFV